MTKYIHFVAYYNPDDDKYYLDDATLMAHFDDRAWFDDETDEWVRPADEEESQLDTLVNDRLAVTIQPGAGATYFATDGSYGSAQGIEIVETSNFDEADWEMLENASDSERPALARHIANVKVVCPQ